MKKFTAVALCLGLWLVMYASGKNAAAQEPSSLEEGRLLSIQQTVEAYLAEKSKLSGTYDLFDEDKKVVRNLRLMRFHVGIERGNGQATARLDCRDAASGAVVTLRAVVIEEGARGWSVRDMTIENVAELNAPSPAAGDAPRAWTGAEIQTAMKDYLAQQAQFGGHVMLYDEERGAMRNLDLVSLNPEVRRLGILSISSAEFKDVQSGETLSIDITVEDKNGRLGIQGLRIRGVRK